MSAARRRALAALLAAPALLGSLVAAAQGRFNMAMHASACERLAMLAERAGKSFVQLAQGVLAERSRRAVRDSVREFEALLPHAAGLAQEAEARDNFVLLRILWKELRVWTRKPPTRENAREVSDRVEEIAWVAAKTARLVKIEGTSQREALAAMHAATLAQRVGRLELLRRIAASDARREADLMDTTAKLGSLLASLLASPHALELEDDLRMAGTQHEFLLAALREYSASAGATAAEAIAKTSDNIADSMERAARLYENGAG